ncbi:MAG: glycosyltransferase family 4 protein [Gammaproteobacteria bacterium]
MNILIVSQYFWPESFRINDFALGLQAMDHNVTVLTGIPNYPNGSFFTGYHALKIHSEDYHGIRIHRVPLISRGKSRSLRLALNYLSFAVSASLLGPLFCKGKYDVIFVFMPSPITVGIPAIILKMLKRAPIFFWVQDLWPESLQAVKAVKSRKILAAIEKLTRFIYQRCDKILVQSQAFIPAIKRLGIAEEKLFYFPNAAEALYQTNDATAVNATLPKGFNIVFTGNIGVAQSFETIIQAAIQLKEYSDIHWIIVGDGRQKEWLSEQIKLNQLENTFHLLGQYPPEAMPYFYEHAEALLITLKKDPIFALTIPSKLQSYLAYGKPVLGALDGEPARIIQDANAGLVGPAEDPVCLAGNILKLYHLSRENRAILAHNGRQYFTKHFERNKLLQQFNSWLDELKEPVECVS